MLKKFAMLLTPFLLAPLSILLTSSPARADYWTVWHKCVFSYAPRHDYIWWSVRIDVRSDGAARPNQIDFHGDEKIDWLYYWDSWDTGGERRRSDEAYEYLGGVVGYKSAPFSHLTWVNKRLRRYANIRLVNRDGRICTSEIEFTDPNR